jgi:hypothetical protein
MLTIIFNSRYALLKTNLATTLLSTVLLGCDFAINTADRNEIPSVWSFVRHWRRVVCTSDVSNIIKAFADTSAHITRHAIVY